MFISSNEKSIINARIDSLDRKVRILEGSLSYVVSQLACQPPKEKRSKSWAWSEASKLEASERMKKYWADKKAKATS